ncbi:MAG: GAF domain-containing protein, partial [Anaerolineales bacterium]|nr:GAF domain-containing protein [Anaerolineales bacterium]
TQNEIYRPLTALLLTNLGIALGAFVLTSLASWLIVQAIVRPINSLVEGYRQVTAGKLDTYVETEREDEIGILTQAFNNTTIQLKTLVTELEKRVEERTKALEERTLQLRTAAQIARDTAFANRLDDLLDRTVTLISERFGFYHTGIFLNDDKNEFAVLRSASSEAGKVMLANQHKLPLGTGLVGHVAKWGQPRIALDVGEDAAHFRNPLLPYTRSEMALPIQTRGRILGVLDIQSEKAHAFDQNDVQVMQIITDQLAVAIEKIRLLEELQESSRSLERALRIQTAREWREFIEHIRHHRGYRYEGTRIEPLAPELIEQFQRQLNKQAIISTEKGEKNSTVVHVPILLRGQILGGLSIRFNAERIPAETVSLIEETANRLALALENARLLQDAQRLANREQQINLIASQLQRANEIDALLQSAVRELGKVLDVPRSFIQIGFVPSTPDTKDSSANR